MGARRGGINPDTALEISLHGTATRLHHDGLAPAEIIAELRTIANGRADLLGKAAGTYIGGWLAAPGMSHPATITIAGYLVQAGADEQVVTAAADQARKNASGSAYSM
jgi:hypothetical protein